MKINAITSNVGNCNAPNSTNKLNKGKNAKNLSFKNFVKTLYYEHKMKKLYNVECNFKTNSFVAECVKKTADIFDGIFGQDSLPQTVDFLSFREYFNEGENALGAHIHDAKFGLSKVFFNSDSSCYKTKNRLQFETLANRIIWWSPTASYLQTFVHEFGHSAHFNHLQERGNGSIMDKLNDTRIPTIIGRFIAKFELGRYSATNMNEFMAERITKDICNNLGSNTDIFIGSPHDLDYERIFENRWEYRYSSPQAYLDYYTQQVWNGDVEKADEVADDMGKYLRKIESLEVVPVLQTVTVPAEQTETVPLLQRFFRGLLRLNTRLTENLDARNNLRLDIGV